MGRFDELHEQFQELIRKPGELTLADVRELDQLLDDMTNTRREERISGAH